MPCDGVHWVIEDDDHSVWMYTACGLVRIARSELDAWATDAKRPDPDYGFRCVRRGHAPSAQLQPRVAKSPDGKLWFTGIDGFSIVDPLHLAVNKLPPPVHIEQITADGKISRGFFGDLRLPPLVRELEIDYTALSLVAPEKNRFE